MIPVPLASFAPAETFLGNGSSNTATPTVARNSYVHPDIVDLYLSGALSDVWHRPAARDTRYMLAEEKRLLAVLKRAHHRQSRETPAKNRSLATAA